MPAAWEQKFDFYIGMVEGAPMSVFLDMAAIDHAPVATHPTGMRINVRMKHPRPDGLRSQEDFEAMRDVEDLLVPAIEQGVDAIYWGRHIINGTTQFMFYVAAGAESDPAFAKKMLPLLRVPDYSPTIQFRSDPDWMGYRNSFPSVFHRHTMWNRHIQAQLESNGDRLTKKRKIDHVAIFPTASAARDAGERLKNAKFRTGRIEGPDNSGHYLLEFHRKDSCESPRPDEITIEILESIEPSDGVYDGWGCVVKK